MARQNINTGTAPNDGTGDTLKTSFTKCNQNFIELYTLASGASISIADTPPASPNNGAMWWESDSGSLFIYYNDGTSSQWVSVAGGGGNIASGVVDGSNAPAGAIGEYQQAILGSPITPTVSVITTILSLALTAGDWDVWMNGLIIPGATGGMEIELTTGASLTGAWPNYQYTVFFAASTNNPFYLGPLRFNSASAMTVSLIVRAGAASQQVNKVLLAARRRR